MVSIEYSEAITETLDILKHTRKEDVMKISPKFMEYLNNNASKTYKPELDHSQKIKDMDLKQKTKVILAIIYKQFWCDENERVEFDNILKENEIKHQAELMEKYNPDDLFKKDISKEENIEKTENTTKMVEYKESFFTKIKNWFKNILK